MVSLSTNVIRRLLFKHQPIVQSTVNLSNNTVEIKNYPWLRKLIWLIINY